MLKQSRFSIEPAFIFCKFARCIMYKRIFYIAFFVLIGCDSSNDQNPILASVGDEELHRSDLTFLFADRFYSYDDSVARAEDYIERWIEDQILVQEASESDKINHEVIEQRVTNFKNDLLIYEYQNSLLIERLDTVVSDDEIRKYYNENQQEFQLNDYLVKVLYIKIPFDAPDVEKIGQAYKLTKPADLTFIQDYAKIYASNFYYDENNWIYFDDILKEIPIQDVNKDKFILKKSKTRFEESGFYYFLNIIDYKLKNTLSPLSFEKQNIKDRILNQRTKQLQEEIRNEIIQNAYAENQVKRY